MELMNDSQTSSHDGYWLCSANYRVSRHLAISDPDQHSAFVWVVPALPGTPPVDDA
jgi:hypothetical protein